MEQRFRTAMNQFLKLYFDSCKEIYEEIGLEKQLSSRQFYYLELINNNENMTSSKLAKLAKLSKPTVTEMIQRFEENEIVYKETHPNDKRKSYIKLTEKGRLLAISNELEAKRMGEKINMMLSPTELEQLQSIFEKLNGE